MFLDRRNAFAQNGSLWSRLFGLKEHWDRALNFFAKVTRARVFSWRTISLKILKMKTQHVWRMNLQRKTSIWNVYAWDLSSEAWSSLAGENDLLEMRQRKDVESSASEVKNSCSLSLASLEEVVVIFSREREVLKSSSKVLSEVLRKKIG